MYQFLSKTCTSTFIWSSVSLQLLNPHDQTPNESWPRAWVEWSPGRGASHCTGPRGCSILTWVMIGGQTTADGHFNSLGNGLWFPYNKSTGSSLCRVSHGILKGIEWCAVDLHGFGMFRGPPGPVLIYSCDTSTKTCLAAPVSPKVEKCGSPNSRNLHQPC